MNKELFVKIYNLLVTYGDTMPSNSGKSLNCYAYIHDTSPIQNLLPAGWTVKSRNAGPDKTGIYRDAMTTVFTKKEMTADDAFAVMDSSIFV